MDLLPGFSILENGPIVHFGWLVVVLTWVPRADVVTVLVEAGADMTTKVTVDMTKHWQGGAGLSLKEPCNP